MKKIEESFSQQGLMRTLGARLAKIERGSVQIECDFSEALSQQHGFFHAGVLTSLADSACGYAALSAMPAECDVLSVEFKINLLRPAKASKIVATAQVLKSGKTLSVCEATVSDAASGLVFAKMIATMIAIFPSEKPNVPTFPA